jgi:hypothetical protein
VGQREYERGEGGGRRGGREERREMIMHSLIPFSSTFNAN